MQQIIFGDAPCGCSFHRALLLSVCVCCVHLVTRLLPKMGNSVGKVITRQWRKDLLMTGVIPVSADRWKSVLHVKGLVGIWNGNLPGLSLEL